MERSVLFYCGHEENMHEACVVGWFNPAEYAGVME